VSRIKLPGSHGAGLVVGVCDELMLIHLDGFRGAVAWRPSDRPIVGEFLSSPLPLALPLSSPIVGRFHQSISQ
jgi:hypothetical protein